MQRLKPTSRYRHLTKSSACGRNILKISKTDLKNQYFF